jgi:hypothetical protein
MLARTARENLKAIVGAYARATGQSRAAVSKGFYGNTRFFDEFFAGDHSISIDKLDEVIARFREAWPPGAPWPALRAAVIRRPKKIVVPKKSAAV